MKEWQLPVLVPRASPMWSAGLASILREAGLITIDRSSKCTLIKQGIDIISQDQLPTSWLRDWSLAQLLASRGHAIGFTPSLELLTWLPLKWENLHQIAIHAGLHLVWSVNMCYFATVDVHNSWPDSVYLKILLSSGISVNIKAQKLGN